MTPVIYLDASLPICSSGLSTAQARALVAFYGDFFRKSHLLAAGRVYHRWQSPDSVVSSYLTLFTFTPHTTAPDSHQQAKLAAYES